MKKVRLDQLVFDQGLSESRERAKAIIMSGVVYVNGQRADKPGAQVAPAATRCPMSAAAVLSWKRRSRSFPLTRPV